MKRRATAGREPMQHKRNITDLEHGGTCFYAALVILAVPAIPAMPRVRPLDHPAFLQRCEAFRTDWTRLHLDAPTGPMRSHPGLKVVIVILLIRKDRHQTWKVLGRDEAEQERRRHAIVEPRTGNEDSQYQAQCIDQQMPLASFDFLAPIIPALGASHLGGLDRLTIDAHGTRGRLAPRGPAGAFAQSLYYLGPRPIVAPLRKVIIDRALGQQ